MPTQSPPSQQLALLNSLSDAEKASCLLSLLLSTGRPRPPLHLSSPSALFPSPASLIHRLASLPDFPIALGASCPYRHGGCSFPCLLDMFSNILSPRREEKVENLINVYFRKRKRIGWDGHKDEEEEKKNEGVLVTSKRIRGSSSSEEVYIRVPDGVFRSLNWRIMTPDSFVKSIPRGLSYGIQRIEDAGNVSRVVEKKEEERDEVLTDAKSALSLLMLENEIVEDSLDEVETRPMGPGGDNDGFCAGAGVSMSKEEELSVDLGKMKDVEEVYLPIWDELFGADPEGENNGKNVIGSNCLGEEPNILGQKSPAQMVVTATEVKEQLPAKVPSGNARASRRRALFHSVERCGPVNTPTGKKKIERQGAKLEIAEKPRHKHDKEGNKGAASVPPEAGTAPKEFPFFESFLVEEEEGSGGYGTVYRARRKHDGATVAIKCPHANAHRNNVNNELKMLERFGGRNFVIKYEGRLNSKNSDCFVLEYVEHDRPEILKKEIDVSQLRWYGYCLFKALASLHKQGVVHRDVKPGNFLFSQKANKGYLIDFNLAMDLHQKYGIPNKLKAENQLRLIPNSPSSAKPLHSTKNRRLLGAKSFDVIKQEVANSKNIKKRNADRTKVTNTASGWNVMKSQGADGSGITSVKDMTSTRTQSAERLREPMPCQGRKELISLLHEAMHSPNHQASSGPISVRKRVAAPDGRVDGRAIYPTPMPLNLYGSILLGDAKQKKEGPCAGTKGFRAPEVLFRSVHQGTKIDIWSAGVTLLYLITGRTPFYGDPEQNIKDIARLRGSEDLWEVSKLHDRQSAFPPELYSRQYLPSVSLLEWCKTNTKRRDFIDSIPSSLIDLVDKCLTVNPRLRISAEEALKHEFFAPCHVSLRKLRLVRQGEAVVPLQEQTALPQTQKNSPASLIRLDNACS